MHSSTAFWLLTVLTVLTAAFASSRLRGPEPLPATAPADQFSAERAVLHLEVLTRAPRPLGSAAHAAVERYLVDQLTALGLSAELQPAFVSGQEPLSGGLVAANVTNVLVRLRGRRESRRAVLVVGHYDSVPAGPGAADDGASVAAMLETLRALTPKPELENDLIFLFVDAEEAALAGARAFQQQHAWAKDVAVVLNFEARGTRGPTLMFETGPQSSGLVRELGRLPTPPFAASYSFEVYRLLPNSTDFGVFKQALKPGLNFAFIHGATGYHTAQDSLDRLDRRSLQHHGETLLGLTRALGKADLKTLTAGGDAMYFPLPGLFVILPTTWAWPLAVGLTLAVLAVLTLGWVRQRWRASRWGVALVVQVVGGGLGGGLGLLSIRLAVPARFYNFALFGGWTSHSLLLLGIALLVAALALVLVRWLAHKLGTDALWAAALTLWLLVTLALVQLAPGAAYLFAVPLAAALPAAVLRWRREPAAAVEPAAVEPAAVKPAAVEPVPLTQLLALALLAAVAAYLWASTLALTGVALGPPAAGPVGMMTAWLLLGLLAPQAALGRSHWPALAALDLALLVIVAVRMSAGFDEQNRRPNTLLYELDATAGQARWLSPDRALDAFTRQFITEPAARQPGARQPGAREPAPLYVPRSTVFVGPAPVLANRGTAVVVRAEERTPAGRTLDLYLDWPQPTERAFLILRPRSALRALALAGHPLTWEGGGGGGGDGGDEVMVTWFAPPAAGADVRVSIAGAEPIELEVVAQRFSLPELPGFPLLSRPADFMPGQDWLTDATLVRSVHRFVAVAADPANRALEPASPGAR